MIGALLATSAVALAAMVALAVAVRRLRRIEVVARKLETMRRDFVANASHELKTPVTAVRSAAETLRLAAASDPEAAARFLDIIERNAERLHRLVDDLLDLSRLEARDFRPHLAALDVVPLAQRALERCHDRAGKAGVRLLPPTGSVVARGDAHTLEQILDNLVDNAVKYGGAGADVSVRVAPQGAKVRVAVADTGPGIEARHLPRLYERFYRVDPGRSRDLGGTGLGLGIVKRLVEAMGGTVGVDSTPGRGSTFWFDLPRG